MPRSASLSWSGIFWPKPSIAEPGSEEDDDQSRSQAALHCPAVRARLDLTRVVLSPAGERERREPRAHAAHRRGVPRGAVVRRLEERLVDEPHELEVLFALARRLAIERRA